MNFIENMRALKLYEAHHASGHVPLTVLKKKVKKASHLFARAIKKNKKVSLIAEFKRKSPSRGEINHTANLKDFVQLYSEYADAISVLTEKRHFGGSLDDLRAARKLTKKPLLRKDFVVDQYQIYQSREAGADAVLLIAGMLGTGEINNLLKVTEKLGMDALVECFDENGLDIVLASNAKIIGINNRNLITMEEDFSKTEKFLSKIPPARKKKSIIVSESSVHSALQMQKLLGIADAALVGTSIMSATLPKAKLKELTGKTLIKICGVTSKKDAQDAIKLGADILGLNFYEKSPRHLTVRNARQIAGAVRGKAILCGVFVNEKKARVERAVQDVGLDMVQFSGDESMQYVNSFSIPLIKAVHVRDENSLNALGALSGKIVLLDSFSNNEYGGTGKRFDEKLVKMKKLKGKLVAFSGGLDAKNVREIINKFGPFMVDVCSGVEYLPGKKSYSKMKEFIAKVTGAQK